MKRRCAGVEITDLSAVAEKHGAVQTITLPGWGGDDAFICKAKRPSLFNMAATGLIPNPLLNTVQQLFTADAKKVNAIELDKQAKALIAMARYALVAPTYDEIIEAGLVLTDEQLLAIYSFALGGVAALEPFRKALRGGPDADGGSVQSQAKRNRKSG